MRGRSGDRRARPLSYANVVSTLALVIAVGGGSALAAGSLADKPKPKPHLTLNRADKAYISAKIAGNIFSANVRADGSMLGSIPAGATSSRNALGDYRVNFGRAITGCTIAVSIAGTSVQLGMIGVGVLDVNTLQVFTRDETNAVADRGFFVEAICPAG